MDSEKQQEYETRMTDFWAFKPPQPPPERNIMALNYCTTMTCSEGQWALMITPDSFSANMRFKGNNSIKLMLGAHLIKVCDHFIISALESSGVFVGYSQPVAIYPWLYRVWRCQKATVTIILLCSSRLRGSYQNCAYRRVYICLCDSPIFCRPEAKAQFEKKEEVGGVWLPQQP